MGTGRIGRVCVEAMSMDPVADCGPGSGLQALIEMQAVPIGTVQQQGSRARHGKAEQPVVINAEEQCRVAMQNNC